MGEQAHYGFSLTTFRYIYLIFIFSTVDFSPSGKLMQIEYALNAVKNGEPSVGLLGE
jgi:hypothetical protein